MKHCLIVEDMASIRKVARHYIHSYGFQVSEAEDAMSAIKHCSANTPDVIVLDWSLPDMTSLDLVSSLRALPGGRRPYIIYFTTEYDQADLTRAFQAGVDDFLIKPFDKDMIEAKFRFTGKAA